MKKIIRLISIMFFSAFSIFYLTGCPLFPSQSAVCIVQFDTKGGSEIVVQVVEKGKTATKPDDPTKEDSTFITWNLSGIEYDFNLPVLADITLEAVWVDSTYTATFDSDGGGTISPIEVNYNTKIAKPNDPSKTGYTFAGWYNGTTLYNFDSLVTGPVTLKAKWTINEYTVTFDSNGGSIVTAIDVDYNTKVTKPMDPTKTGYTFDGWYNGTTQYNFNTLVTAPITLKAKWNINQYSLSFDSDGGSAVETVSVDYNTKVSKPMDPTKTGYTFAGWYNGTTLYDFDTPVTTAVTLKAKWNINQYSVSFDSDGGSAVETVSVDYNTKVSKPMDPTKTGYTFDGWYNGTTQYNFDTIVTAPITLKAKWNINQYSVSFDSDGGSAVETVSADYNTKVSKPMDPTKTGYTFAGWYNGTTLYSFDTLVTAPITLKAKWTTVMYDIIFDSDGGSPINPQSIAHNGMAEEPVPPTKEGYVFVDWYIGETVFDFGTKITSHVTLTAVWEEAVMDLDQVIQNLNSPNFTLYIKQIISDSNQPSVSAEATYYIYQINGTVYLKFETFYGEAYYIFNPSWETGYLYQVDMNGIPNINEGTVISFNATFFGLDPSKMQLRTDSYIYDISLTPDELKNFTGFEECLSYEYTFDLKNLHLHLIATNQNGTMDITFSFTDLGVTTYTLPEGYKQAIMSAWEEDLMNRNYMVETVTEDSLPILETYLNKYHGLWASTSNIVDLITLYRTAIAEVDSLNIIVDNLKMTKFFVNNQLNQHLAFLAETSTAESILVMESILANTVTQINECTSTDQVISIYTSAINQLNNAKVNDEAKIQLQKDKQVFSSYIYYFYSSHIGYLTNEDITDMYRIVIGYDNQVKQVTTQEQLQSLYNAFHTEMDQLEYALTGETFVTFQNDLITRLMTSYKDLTLADFDVASYLATISQNILSSTKATDALFIVLQADQQITLMKDQQNAINELKLAYEELLVSATDESAINMQLIYDQAIADIKNATENNRIQAILITANTDLQNVYVYSKIKDAQNQTIQEMNAYYDERYIIATAASQIIMEEVLLRNIALVQANQVLSEISTIKNNFMIELDTVVEIDPIKKEMKDRIYDLHYFINTLGNSTLDYYGYQQLVDDLKILQLRFKEGTDVDTLEPLCLDLLNNGNILHIDQTRYVEQLKNEILNLYDLSTPSLINIYHLMVTNIEAASTTYDIFGSYRDARRALDEERQRIGIYDLMSRSRDDLFMSADDASGIAIHTIYSNYLALMENAVSLDEMFSLLRSAKQEMENAFVYSAINEAKNMVLSEIEQRSKIYLDTIIDARYLAIMSLYKSSRQQIVNLVDINEMRLLRDRYFIELVNSYASDNRKLSFYRIIDNHDEFISSIQSLYDVADFNRIRLAFADFMIQIADETLSSEQKVTLFNSFLLLLNETPMCSSSGFDEYKMMLKNWLQMYFSGLSLTDFDVPATLNTAMINIQNSNLVITAFNFYLFNKAQISLMRIKQQSIDSLRTKFNSRIVDATDESIINMQAILDNAINKIKNSYINDQIIIYTQLADKDIINAYVLSELKYQQNLAISDFNLRYDELFMTTTDASVIAMNEVLNRYITLVQSSTTVSDVIAYSQQYYTEIELTYEVDPNKVAMQTKIQNADTFLDLIETHVYDNTDYYILCDQYNAIQQEFQQGTSLSTIEQMYLDFITHANNLLINQVDYQNHLINEIGNQLDYSSSELAQIYDQMVQDINLATNHFAKFEVYLDTIEQLEWYGFMSGIFDELTISRDSLLQRADDASYIEIQAIYNQYELLMMNSTDMEEIGNLKVAAIQAMNQAFVYSAINECRNNVIDTIEDETTNAVKTATDASALAMNQLAESVSQQVLLSEDQNEIYQLLNTFIQDLSELYVEDPAKIELYKYMEYLQYFMNSIESYYDYEVFMELNRKFLNLVSLINGETDFALKVQAFNLFIDEMNASNSTITGQQLDEYQNELVTYLQNTYGELVLLNFDIPSLLNTTIINIQNSEQAYSSYLIYNNFLIEISLMKDKQNVINSLYDYINNVSNEITEGSLVEMQSILNQAILDINNATTIEQTLQQSNQAYNDMLAAYVAIYDVTFDSQGGSVVDPQRIANNDVLEEPVPPTRQGYIFVNWYLGDVVYNFNTPVTGPITLIAVWQEAITLNQFMAYLDGFNLTIQMQQTTTQSSFSTEILNAYYKISKIGNTMYLYIEEPSFHNSFYLIENFNWNGANGFGYDRNGDLFYINNFSYDAFDSWILPIYRTFSLYPHNMVKRVDANIYDITILESDLLYLTGSNDWLSYEYTLNLETLQLRFYGTKADYEVEIIHSLSDLGNTNIELPAGYKEAVIQGWKDDLDSMHYSFDTVTANTRICLYNFLEAHKALWETANTMEEINALYEQSLLGLNLFGIQVDSSLVRYHDYAIYETIKFNLDHFVFLHEKYLNENDYLLLVYMADECNNQLYGVTHKEMWTIYHNFLAEVNQSSFALSGENLVLFKADVVEYMYMEFGDYNLEHYNVPDYLLGVTEEINLSNQATTVFTILMDCQETINLWSFVDYRLNEGKGNFEYYYFTGTDESVANIQLIWDEFYVEINNSKSIGEVNFLSERVNTMMYEAYIYSPINEFRNNTIYDINELYHEQCAISKTTSYAAMEEVLNNYIAAIRASSSNEEIITLKAQFQMQLLVVSEVDPDRVVMKAKFDSLYEYIDSLYSSVLDYDSYWLANDDYDTLYELFLEGTAIDILEQSYQQVLNSAIAVTIDQSIYQNELETNVQNQFDLTQPSMQSIYSQMVFDMGNATDSYSIYEVHLQYEEALTLEQLRLSSIVELMTARDSLIGDATEESKIAINTIFSDYERQIHLAITLEEINLTKQSGLDAMQNAYVAI